LGDRELVGGGVCLDCGTDDRLEDVEPKLDG